MGTLGLWVLELFATYATDGRTKATLIAPFPTIGGIIKYVYMYIGAFRFRIVT